MKHTLIVLGLVLVLVSGTLTAAPSLRMYYKVDRDAKKVEFWCPVDKIEVGLYIIALGFPQIVEQDTQFKQILKTEGCDVVQVEKPKYRETDITRLEATIPGMDARGFQFEVKSIGAESKLEYRTEVSFATIEKARVAGKPIVAFISRNYGPVYYIVDYFTIDPRKILP